MEDAQILKELRELADVYPALWQFKSLAGTRQYARLYGLVHDYVRPGCEVLDWGAGSGHFSYFLARSDFRVTGYALSRGIQIRVLDEFPEYRFVSGDMDDPVTIPFEADSFDAVASIGVLEHVRETGGDDVASLKEIRRVLRPGGVFICFHFPNRYSWVDAVARFIGEDHHTYRYTRARIQELVDLAGLELLETRRYAVLPRNPLHRLPSRLVDSEEFARVYDTADESLARILPFVCTNHFFVARRPEAAPA